MRPTAASDCAPAQGSTSLSDDHHDYECSQCRSRGGPCLEALWLAERVARGLAARADALPAEFELTSETLFRGCGKDCAVRLRIRGTSLDIACGLAPGSRDPRMAQARVRAWARVPQPLAVGG